jgi:hypothetical protein
MLFEVLVKLFNSSDFLARGHCGQWTDSLKLTYIVSNAFIALAYFLISSSLLVLWKGRRNVFGSPGILLGFAAFIAACGMTHLCDVTAFWWPAYRFYTLLDAITAVLSVGVAMAVPSAVWYLLRRLPPAD